MALTEEMIREAWNSLSERDKLHRYGGDYNNLVSQIKTHQQNSKLYGYEDPFKDISPPTRNYQETSVNPNVPVDDPSYSDFTYTKEYNNPKPADWENYSIKNKKQYIRQYGDPDRPTIVKRRNQTLPPTDDPNVIQSLDDPRLVALQKRFDERTKRNKSGYVMPKEDIENLRKEQERERLALVTGGTPNPLEIAIMNAGDKFKNLGNVPKDIRRKLNRSKLGQIVNKKLKQGKKKGKGILDWVF
jgi:molecular chaperone GrpE (heat shock protein)